MTDLGLPQFTAPPVLFGSAPVATASSMRRALRRAADGVALDRTEAAIALQARGEDLMKLSASAARVRDAGLLAAGRPGVITYSKKVFIPLTRLCRDRCHYCTFATTPGRVESAYLSPDEILAIAEQGRQLGCKEALFTLGDRPEERWNAASKWLDEAGYDTTLDYVRAMSIRVLETTGLLPHLNPGVMSWEEMARLKPVAPSMGMMLETTSTEIFTEKSGAHYGSPDKEPAVRLRVLDDAGRSSIPFTTGILIGIGETLSDRVDAIFEIRSVARSYRGVQEVIIQNFRAKPDTAMAHTPDAEITELLATVAVARLILGSKMRIQAPPNLIGSGDAVFKAVIDAGIDDWGGVSPLTPDHVNPERPWPQIDDLAARTAAAGFTLAERLTIYPEFVKAGEPWLDPRLRAHVDALADPVTGLARTDVIAVGRPWQEPEETLSSSGRTDLATSIDTDGRTGDRRSDFSDVYGDWDALKEKVQAQRSAPESTSSEVAAALRIAENDPGSLDGAEALALMTATGVDLEAVCSLADDVRKSVNGDDVTYVVNRNINFTNVCYTGCRFCAFAQRRNDADAYTLSVDEVAERAEVAWSLGATEVCMQGGIHPDWPGTAYFDLVRAIKARVPDIHVHAFSPMEVVNGATRADMSIREWLSEAKAAGLGSIPGTAAEILDDEVRWVLTKGKLPTKSWVDVISTAHSLGIPSSSTMMYGHVDTAEHWVAHIALLRRLQAETGGFTEFVPLPFIHTNAPIYLAGLARAGATFEQSRAVHAVARLMLHGSIDNIQTSWVKLGPEGTATMLNGGVNDLGGTLMEETISRMAGSEFGSFQTVEQLRAITEPIGRRAIQRTTTYGRADSERIEAASHFVGLAALNQTSTGASCGAADGSGNGEGAASGPTLLTLGSRL
ncbi:7,8-didemethyl-8-hydroxy-5-deazariboflavin synthase [Nakamurella antarctica]|uniref:FO synthase n=1 Tax=Nakamurella antarctica TaxID=1902245 RepID=A0A3G8ZJ36_9ACTN|nr:bifunctional FO biosynthesis protein CofGH [Nakamurella antarctica]AZI57369.1 7,8-didemethyl-8-hydroxy-5-deazariboflavin synthase [Nakamurella antarctica]